MTYISAWVDHANTDNTVEAVYGGDLTGSVWRFDLSGTTTASWKVQLVAKLVDSSNNAQPVTSEPELGVVSGFRVIYVGTGQYLGSTDIPGATGANASATSTQTMYALKEPEALRAHRLSAHDRADHSAAQRPGSTDPDQVLHHERGNHDRGKRHDHQQRGEPRIAEGLVHRSAADRRARGD